MDTNSFRSENAAGLLDETRLMTERRARVLGPSYRLFYRNPVHLVRGQGAYLWDASGRQYLDVYNNVASIGHGHPAVAAAISAQQGTLNTNTRYLHDGILNYSDELLATLPAEITQMMYMCTGSEANDLAIRVAHSFTGGTGVIVSSEAYHGNTSLTSELSPALGGAQQLGDNVRLIAAPDSYRVDTENLEDWFAARMQEQIDDLAACGIKFSAFLADSIFSSDGVFSGPRGYLRKAIDVVHANGGVFIADEVQPGFARTGEEFWGFARHAVVPDLVTMGKPMGNGVPISGMAARAEVLEPFAASIPYFNTFGGNPMSIAAAQAVLTTIKTEGLQEHSRQVGQQLRDELLALAQTHEAIGDVRGSGLFVGLELVTDRAGKTPGSSMALNVVESLREDGVLTSVAGPHGNVLKLRPPLAFGAGDIDWLVSSLDRALHRAAE